MESHSHHHHHATKPLQPSKQVSHFKLAMSATIHCLLGCGLGEIAGMIIATAIGLNMINATILGVMLGFVAGLALGTIPLIRSKFTLGQALKTVVIAEGLSIVVMETFEVITQAVIPGVMTASLADPVFWLGMIASLIVGFVAAFPVNYVLVKKGIRHYH